MILAVRRLSNPSTIDGTTGAIARTLPIVRQSAAGTLAIRVILRSRILIAAGIRLLGVIGIRLTLPVTGLAISALPASTILSGATRPVSRTLAVAGSIRQIGLALAILTILIRIRALSVVAAAVPILVKPLILVRTAVAIGSLAPPIALAVATVAVRARWLVGGELNVGAIGAAHPGGLVQFLCELIQFALRQAQGLGAVTEHALRRLVNPVPELVDVAPGGTLRRTGLLHKAAANQLGGRVQRAVHLVLFCGTYGVVKLLRQDRLGRLGFL